MNSRLLICLCLLILSGCDSKPVAPERNEQGGWSPEEVAASEEDVRDWCEGKKSTYECQQLLKSAFEMKRINKFKENRAEDEESARKRWLERRGQ